MRLHTLRITVCIYDGVIILAEKGFLLEISLTLKMWRKKIAKCIMTNWIWRAETYDVKRKCFFATIAKRNFSHICNYYNYTRESYPCHIQYYNEVYESLGKRIKDPLYLEYFRLFFVDSNRSMRGRKNLRLRELSIRKVHSTFYTRTTRDKYIHVYMIGERNNITSVEILCKFGGQHII